MIVPADPHELSPGQEQALLDIQTNIKTSPITDPIIKRRFLDHQAKLVVRAVPVFSPLGLTSAVLQLKYRPYLRSFAIKRDIGEVVFTLRLAYQSINTRLEPNPPGSYFNDICDFITEIIRERTAHSERVRANRALKQQAHRKELQDIRDAADALQKLKKGSKSTARHFTSFLLPG